MLPKGDKDKWRLSGKRQKPYGGPGSPQKRIKGPREIKTLSVSWKMEKQTHNWTCNEKRMSEHRDNRMVSSARARPSLGKTYPNTHNS